MELKVKPKIVDNIHGRGGTHIPMNEAIHASARVFTIFFEQKAYLAEGPLDGAVARVLGRVLPRPAGPSRAAGEGQCFHRHGDGADLLEKLETADAEGIRNGWNSKHGY